VEEDRALSAKIAEEERQYQNRRQMYLIEERKKREEQMLEREEMLEGLVRHLFTQPSAPIFPLYIFYSHFSLPAPFF